MFSRAPQRKTLRPGFAGTKGRFAVPPCLASLAERPTFVFPWARYRGPAGGDWPRARGWDGLLPIARLQHQGALSVGAAEARSAPRPIRFAGIIPFCATNCKCQGVKPRLFPPYAMAWRSRRSSSCICWSVVAQLVQSRIASRPSGSADQGENATPWARRSACARVRMGKSWLVCWG